MPDDNVLSGVKLKMIQFNPEWNKRDSTAFCSDVSVETLNTLLKKKHFLHFFNLSVYLLRGIQGADCQQAEVLALMVITYPLVFRDDGGI